jgi:excisionase family DNA binding protein
VNDVVYAPQLMTLREAAQVLHLSRQTTWRRTKDGSIKTVKIGPTTRIPRSEIDRLLAGANRS